MVASASDQWPQTQRNQCSAGGRKVADFAGLYQKRLRTQVGKIGRRRSNAQYSLGFLYDSPDDHWGREPRYFAGFGGEIHVRSLMPAIEFKSRPFPPNWT